MVDYTSLQERIRPVETLILAGKFQMAIDKLQYMLKKDIFLPEERWRAYQRIGDCYCDMLKMDEAAEAYWQSANSTTGLLLPIQQNIYSNYLMVSHNLSGLGAEELAQRHFLYQKLTETIPRFKHIRRKHNKIRVGYIADKFIRNVLTFFSVHLFEGYNRHKFYVHIYSIENYSDAITEQLRQKVDGYTDFTHNTSADVIARRIYKDEIDILIDLGGHTLFGLTVQVLAYKPAPIQMAGIGYMSTSGLKDTDYFLTDNYLDPPGEHDNQFSEKLLRLEKTHWCYVPPGKITVGRIRDYNRLIVFGSFNKFSKITAEMLCLWKKILTEIPQSRLLLKCPERQPYLKAFMRKKMQKFGFRPEQYELEIGETGYLERYGDVDIILDTYPYTGGATTCDALLCGVPVVTMYGERHGTRFGYSMLKNLGLEELAASNETEYISKAVALARDLPRLKQLHERLPQMMKDSPIMDYTAYVSNLEKQYEVVYQEWIRGMSK